MKEVTYEENDQTYNNYLIRETLSKEINRVSEEVRKKVEHLSSMIEMYKQYEIAIKNTPYEVRENSDIKIAISQKETKQNQTKTIKDETIKDETIKRTSITQSNTHKGIREKGNR